MTKAAKIEAHLRVYKSITQEQARDHYRAWRLAPIILRLRERGWRIDSVLHPTDDGRSRWAEYRLVKLP